MKKLTLSVDARVVARAKTFAHKRGTSVSRMVEQYLDAVSSPTSAAEPDLPPVTRRLLGALRGARVDPSDYLSYLENKHI